MDKKALKSEKCCLNVRDSSYVLGEALISLSKAYSLPNSKTAKLNLFGNVFWVLVVNLKLIPSESSFINVPEHTNLRRVYLQAFVNFLQDIGLALADFCHLCLLLQLLIISSVSLLQQFDWQVRYIHFANVSRTQELCITSGSLT